VITLREAGPLAAELPEEVACKPIGAQGRSRRTWLKLARFLSKTRADVVHARNTGCWTDAALAAAIRPGTRFILGFHGLEFAGPMPARQRRTAWLAGKVGARFTSVSECGRAMLAEQARIPLDRITVLPNGVDRESLSVLDPGTRSRVRDSLGFPENLLVFGIIGSLTPVKGHATLLEAFSKLTSQRSDVRLLVVGDGPLQPVLARQAQDLGIASLVHWTGWRDDVPALLTAMDAYVCASESEGVSNSVLEAMTAALPMVTTRVGDHPLLIRHEMDGLVVPIHDSAAMASALHQLAGSPELRRRLGPSARDRSKEFDFGITVKSYSNYYDKFSETSRGRAVESPLPVARQQRHEARGGQLGEMVNDKVWHFS
jgi:glycosyltransferase involved in cell wall biosynthesis